MREILAIACGGAVGAITRHLAAVGARRLFGEEFPWGTLLVNLFGCFLLGAIAEYVIARREMSPLFFRAVTIGFLGALTTFSTFGHDTFRQLEDGRHSLAFLNIAANMVLGLSAVWLGVLAGRALVGGEVEV